MLSDLTIPHVNSQTHTQLSLESKSFMGSNLEFTKATKMNKYHFDNIYCFLSLTSYLHFRLKSTLSHFHYFFNILRTIIDHES